MIPQNDIPWADEIDGAVTVCDTAGTVLYQDTRSTAVNGYVSGRSLLHRPNERPRAPIPRLLDEGGLIVYTI